MMKSTTRFLLLFLSLSLARCGGEQASSARDETRDEVTGPAAGQPAPATNSFGLSLFERICGPEEEENVFISPASISMALAMALNGAGGSTRAAMMEVLGLEGRDMDEVDREYARMMERLSMADPKVTFEIANSLWYREGLPVEEEYVRLAERFFGAAVRGLDFSSPEAPGVINSWVSENTNGKIEEIIQSIRSELVLFLINAIYFKGTWTVEFDEDMTRDEPFHTTAGDTVSCRMMGQKGEFPYHESDLLQAIELPYGAGEFSMVVLLPGSGAGTDSLISWLDAEGLAVVVDSLTVREGRLALPKFKLEYDITLNDVLKDLGMSVAFDPRAADFTGILSRGQLYIDEVKHKTFVEVNEQGTEAAAATSVGIAITSVRPEGFTMRVDRPFLFFIRDTGSGAILFAGRITNPVLE